MSPSDRDLAQQWLARDRVKDLDFDLFAKHQFQSSRKWPDGTTPTAPNWNPGCTCGASHYYFEHSRHLAELTAEYFAAILDTPGVEVETMTMYVGKPGGSWVAETRLHIMLPVESLHV